MKKVAVIAYGFPPVGGAGVQRPVKFVKYLREFGWEPLVLTVENPSVPVVDSSLLKDVPSAVAIYKAKTLEPSYGVKSALADSRRGLGFVLKRALKRCFLAFLLPDVQVLWWPALLVKLVKLIRTQQPDCLFVTGPPFSSLLPVVWLGSLFKVPVVADFRDEWSFARNNLEQAARHRLAAVLDGAMERYVVKNCTALTAANGSYLAAISTAHGPGSLGKGFVITNGYDEDDFAACVTSPQGEDDRITIAYAGTVWKATSLAPFFTALKALLVEDPPLAGKVSVRIYGRVVDAEMASCTDPFLAGNIELFDYTAHDALLKELSRADLLLFSISDLPGAEKIIAGKVFEYMATGKHIFAMIPEGESKSILVNSYNNYTAVEPTADREIRRLLREVIDDIALVRKRIGNPVPQFTRRELTAQLAEVLDHARALR